MLKSSVLALFIGIFAVLPAASQEEKSVRFKGAQTFYEFGNIVGGVELANDTLDNMWAQRFGGTFDLEATRGEYLDLYFGAGSIFWHAIPSVENNSASSVFYGDAILTKAYAQFTFGDREDPGLTGKLGFFPVKYSHSRNLGEYLFRTGTYPTYIVTGNGYTVVNTSSATVLGTQWTHRLGSGFSHDLFFTSERQTFPLHDFSLTYLAQYKGGIFNAGLGVQFERLIPVAPSLTTPGHQDNTVFTNEEGRKMANNPEYYNLLAKAASRKAEVAGGAGRTADSIRYADDAVRWKQDEELVLSLRAHWDTIPASSRPPMEKITFKGIKPLAMVSLDFKPLFGEGLFRNDEMVVYSEAVLMGVENQPVYFENRMDRLAVMAGVNLPTFGLLDQLNFEVERWTSKYVNGYRNAREGNLPQPDYNYDRVNGYDPVDWSGDDLKLSVFLERKLLDGFHLQAQAARDHLRGRRFTRVVTENSLLTDGSHWSYFFKLQASL